MLIVVFGIIFFTIGYVFLTLVFLFPILRVIYFDWLASIFFVVPYVFVVYRLYVTDSFRQADRIPIWKHLINYLRRDNEIIPLVGERAYPGESFIDVPELGLMEFLGKDCVYRQGDKKVVWGLENINFTPDPRYFNLTHLLYTIGFKDSEDVKNVLKGNDLFLMGKVFLAMNNYDGVHGVKKLVKEMEDYNKETITFSPKDSKSIGERVDDLFVKKR